MAFQGLQLIQIHITITRFFSVTQKFINNF